MVNDWSTIGQPDHVDAWQNLVETPKSLQTSDVTNKRNKQEKYQNRSKGLAPVQHENI